MKLVLIASLTIAFLLPVNASVDEIEDKLFKINDQISSSFESS